MTCSIAIYGSYHSERCDCTGLRSSIAGGHLNPPLCPSTQVRPLGRRWAATSGSCFIAVGQGCGSTGWVQSSFTIATTGNYFFKVGTVNWTIRLFESGLALDGVTVGGVPINPPDGGGGGPVGTPEPSSILCSARLWLASARSVARPPRRNCPASCKVISFEKLARPQNGPVFCFVRINPVPPSHPLRNALTLLCLQPV